MQDAELLADQPLGEKLIKKGGWLYLFMFLTAPVGYFIRVIVSNTLSVEDVWLFYSILGLVTLVSMYNDLWLTEALQYFLPKYRINKQYNNYKTIIYLTLFAQIISGIVIAWLMWWWADWLAIHHFHSPFAKDILRFFCFYFIGINFLQVLSSIYLSFQDVIANNVAEGAKLYSTLIFTCIFWLTGTLTITNFAISRISGLVIWILISLVIFVFKYKKTLKLWSIIYDKSLIKKQFHYAFWVFLWANILTLFSQVDQQIVINFLGAKQAWYYANFRGMIAVFNFIVGPLLSILFPIVNELITKNELGKLKIFQNLLYKYFSILALSMGWLFVAFGPQIASVMFWVKFAYSGTLSMYIGPFLIFYTPFVINYLILAGLGKIKERVGVLWISLWINILSNIILIYWFGLGLLGAVISLILWWICLRWLSFRIVNHHIKIDFDRNFFGKNLLLISPLTILCRWLGTRVLVFENTMRYQNILYLLSFFVWYYALIGLLNWKNIRMLVNEIKNLRKN